MLLLLKNFFNLKGYLFSHKHVHIFFRGGSAMKINFQMLDLWPQWNYTPSITFNDYMKVECALIEKGYNLIKKADFLNNYKLMMIR